MTVFSAAPYHPLSCLRLKLVMDSPEVSEIQLMAAECFRRDAKFLVRATVKEWSLDLGI
jgi:hypothetical protein